MSSPGSVQNIESTQSCTVESVNFLPRTSMVEYNINHLVFVQYANVFVYFAKITVHLVLAY